MRTNKPIQERGRRGLHGNEHCSGFQREAHDAGDFAYRYAIPVMLERRRARDGDGQSDTGRKFVTTVDPRAPWLCGPCASAYFRSGRG